MTKISRSKIMKYFDHDTTAGNDDKVVALRLLKGGAAVDAYWCVLEEIYRCETDFATDKNQAGFVALAHRLCVDADTLSDWIDSMVEVGLLQATNDGYSVGSERAARNIASYNARRETARENGKLGGRKPKSNRVKTKPVTKGKPSANPSPAQPKTKEKEKLLDTHKGYPNNTASDGAAAAEAAPPAAQYGPLRCRMPGCDGHLLPDPSLGKFRCGTCRATFDRGELGI
ncbi:MULTISPECIES: Lin1244/Lin1753 domain-containing protein [Gordonibacter]|uniref:DUF4373 domain-containing protein n=2 Tax=Gordonibacter TaxID=644652 RepID=A0ABT7DU61_9ACTN|nr:MULTISPECIES: Lin1244/Lin1753 domain-containing protein [unclassified Gordonibacter]MDJ1651650.1 DUF4373 domain-containing protein [Gordonibacter sp. KGMB12511]